MRNYNTFLHLFIYYMCSRCEVAAPGHDRQPDDGSGRHAHNGEMLDLLEPHAPSVDRIFNAYINYRSVGDGRSTLTAIAHGYNNTPDTTAIQRKLRLYNEQHLYTALQTIELYHNSVWLRHGLEHTHLADYRTGADFPPDMSRFNVGKLVLDEEWNQGYYAVDLDTVPFRGCSVHRVDDDTGQSWAYVAGYIPVELFNQTGKLYNPPDRDHYYARTTPIPAQNWIYIYTDIPKRAVNRRHQETALEQLCNSDLSRIHHSTLLQYTRLKNSLYIHSTIKPQVLPYTAAKR